MTTLHVFGFVDGGVAYDAYGQIQDPAHGAVARKCEWAAARTLQDISCERHPGGSLRVRITITPEDARRGVGAEAVARVVEACCHEMQSRAELAIA